MSLKNKMIFVSTISLLGACASKKDLIFEEQKSSDLVEKLDINKVDTFSKFKTSKLSSDDQEKLSQQIQAKKEKEKAKLVVAKATPKKVVKTKKVTKKVKKNVAQPKVVEGRRNFSYASDYPEKFKTYDKKSVKVWDQFAPYFYDNEEFTMSISYLGITAGHIRLQTKPRVKVGNKTAFHFHGRMKSAKFYEYIYSLDDSIDTYLDTEEFLPIKYSMIQRESGQDVDDLQLFDSEKNKTYFWYNRLKKGKTTKREKESYIPHFFQDSFSALYFVRGLPLKVGDVYEFPIVTRAKIWMLNMKVERTEKIDVMGKKIDAFRINAVTRFPGVLKKKGDIIFWYSNDKYRKLLKFKAKVKIGAIEGELLNYKRGSQRISALDINDPKVMEQLEEVNAKHL